MAPKFKQDSKEAVQRNQASKKRRDKSVEERRQKELYDDFWSDDCWKTADTKDT